MISNFELKFGRTPSAISEPVIATQVTVFVGPNNSGKSRVLSEIERYCRNGTADENAVILKSISFAGVEEAQAIRAIEKIRQPPRNSESVGPGHIFVGSIYGRLQVSLEQLRAFVQNPSINTQAFCQWYLTHNTLLLDGRSRINLVNAQPAGDLQQPPSTSFQLLFCDDEKRHEVRRMVLDAFGVYFVIDPTNLGQLRIRLSEAAPNDDRLERGIHRESITFHASAKLIDQASDGVRAFTGIVVEITAGDPSIIMIDEPEAFLHPSLASKLGFEVSKAALATNKRIFISTHSPMFVMGCIQSNVPINIIRLTYRGEVATARILPNEDILSLMRHPLLRSTNVLNALFYEFVIITESDADRAFYQEVNERLLQFKPEWGIPNCLFINAQNKQTVKTILSPLRKLGIPAIGIVDIDILKEGGAVWAGFLESANIPLLSYTSLAQMRKAVKDAMETTGKNMKTQGGLDILKAGDYEAAQNLLLQLASYGLFVVPGGELESWLKILSVTGHGPTWLIRVFERMGEDPTNANYVKPDDGDVWEFMSKIKDWLMNPNRKGIPD